MAYVPLTLEITVRAGYFTLRVRDIHGTLIRELPSEMDVTPGWLELDTLLDNGVVRILIYKNNPAFAEFSVHARGIMFPRKRINVGQHRNVGPFMFM